MTGKRIAKRVVDEFTPSQKDRFLWDSELKGFGVKCTPAGRKTYIYQYRARGSTKRVTIGVHGPLAPQQARDRAQRLAAEVALGRDPAGERASRREIPTFRQFAGQYLQDHAIPKKKPKSVREDEALLRNHLLPRFGGHMLDMIKSSDVSGLHMKLRPTPYLANRALALLRHMFTMAIRWQIVADNPASQVTPYREKRRERFLSGDEITRLSQTLRALREDGESPFVVAAIEFLLLTGCRVGEALSLRWEDVDVPRRQIRLPDSKTGRRTVFISPPMERILTELPVLSDNPFVFCGSRSGRPIVNLRKPWMRVCDAADLEGVRLHDLRHTFASVAAMSGHGLPVVGALLGHSNANTTARYAHFADEALFAANADVAEKIASRMMPRSCLV
jgi:integrase